MARVGFILSCTMLCTPLLSLSQSSVQLTLLYQRSGAAGDGFGESLAAGGDIDSNGTADWLAGALTADTNGVSESGKVFVFSGGTGSLLYTKVRTDTQFFADHYGFSVAAPGDVNGDGWADFIVGTPSAHDVNLGNAIGLVQVFSGKTGGLVYTTFGDLPWIASLGYSVAGIGFSNTGTFEDFISGAPTSFNVTLGAATGAFRTWFGPGIPSLTIYTDQMNAAMGQSVSGLDDIDNDLFDDYLVGAPGYPVGIFGHTGRVFLFSGNTGGVLRIHDATLGDWQLGVKVFSIRDINADNVVDYLIAAPYGADTLTYTERGRVKVFSGATGSQFFVLEGTAPAQRFGWSAAGLDDIDGDSSGAFLPNHAQGPKIPRSDLSEASGWFWCSHPEKAPGGKK